MAKRQTNDWEGMASDIPERPRAKRAHPASKHAKGAVTLENFVPADSSFTPSPMQRAMLHWVRHGEGNAMVVAVAGAGKTTTLCAATHEMAEGTTGYAVVFNRKNADELRARFPSHVECGTFHSFWMRACTRNMPGVKVDAYKVSDIVRRVLPHYEERTRMDTVRVVVEMKYREYEAPLRQLVGFAKNLGVGILRPDRPNMWRNIIEHQDLLIDEKVDVDKLIEYASKVLETSNAATQVIDFDDMLYLPLLRNWSIPRKDFVFVDEAQDTNPVQRELVLRMVKENTGRLIFVGDPHQAIYGFRGATSDAMHLMQEMTKAIELPLTVSYRCPRAVVEHARKYVSHIQAADTAPVGKVTTVAADTLPKTLFVPGSAVVCRNMAPLVALAYMLMARRVPVNILGKDLGKRLIDLVERMHATNVTELAAKLDEHLALKSEYFLAKGDEANAARLADQVESIIVLIGTLPATTGINEVTKLLDDLFADTATRSAVTLCTVHRAKGLEWERVVIIRPDLMPSKYARQAWQLEQENNIAYVAVTRAKSELVIAQGDRVSIQEK